MALVFKWDQRDRHRIRFTRQALEIQRGCMVTGVTVTPDGGGTDPEVWVRVLADAACPKPGVAVYPSATYPFSSAVLDEIVPESVGPAQPNSWVRMTGVYRTPVPQGDGSAGASAWTVTDSTVSEFVPCYATSAGGAALTAWYKKGEPDTTAVFPGVDAAHEAKLKAVRGVHREVPRRVLRVTGVLLAAAWNGAKASIRALSGKINHTTWGSDPRGRWLFTGPTTRTSDFGKSFSVELLFKYDPLGHYAVAPYFDEHGQIPPDIASEATIRAAGPPTENTYIGRNGIMMASIYPEGDFSAFAFTPNS